VLVETAADVEALEVEDPDNLAYSTQTTLSVADTAEVVAALKAKFPSIKDPHKEDICYATTNRQAAVKTIAPKRVETIGRYAPNVPGAVLARKVLTPFDLEQTFGITEGNIFHGDINMGQLFFLRPIPGWAQYNAPIRNLYLCGAGTHPGGGVTGAPGYNAAHKILRERK
jgi:phytoene dehydrogenase-like protein